MCPTRRKDIGMKPHGARSYGDAIEVDKSIWGITFHRSIEGAGHAGMCYPDTQRLALALGMSPFETLVTFHHELFHAFEDEYDFNVRHKSIEQLAEAMTRFTVQNPNYIPKIMNGPKNA